ncbi:MAG: caspase family protein [Thermoanaerobaculia bacterium]|nr:caspase family protein [Thermoanaerobaculia bacterium]
MASASLTLLLGASVLSAESPGCAQARAIVEQVERLYRSPQVDHGEVLSKLETARHLCPTLGAAFKWSYCSATALGRAKEARVFKDRAIFNDVSDLSCAPAGIAPPPRPLPGFVRAKHALIIGIGRFRDPAVPSLQFAAKDARDLAAVLTDPRYGRFDPANVTLLTDEHATRANILNALQDLFLKAAEDDLVLLYVSSHGSPRREESGLSGVGYIVTYDTALSNIWVDALDYQSFSSRAALIKARRKVAFLDTCYSGQASRPGEKALTIEASGVGAETAKLFLSGEGTYVITSSKADERSFESEALANSYFTHHLIAALKRSEAPATLQEIFAALAREVPASVKRDFAMPQHPQIVPADGTADLRIGVAPRPE